MSSEHQATPKTVVPDGITDPVLSARAELKAALAAIELKANVPARAAEATGEKAAQAREFAKREPVAAAIVAVSIAASVGAAVWGAAKLIAKG
ncbi:hypothetical protein [Microbacterium halophytorum]|uniref:hypothetical protein n=1 Tax=Microbacterium halophytorum TaxID=2067568 RepID=UPI000CFB58CC|nr:hypothetical protein [Microbacterium halophytorum]